MEGIVDGLAGEPHPRQYKGGTGFEFREAGRNEMSWGKNEGKMSENEEKLRKGAERGIIVYLT